MTWIANLSNGDTITEGKPVAGERTPWQKLLRHCRENNITITGLRLSVRDVTIDAMPVKMCDGYLHAYEAERLMWSNVSKIKQGIGSVVGDLVYITWIDINPFENNMNYIHQDIRPLSEVKIHTTID